MQFWKAVYYIYERLSEEKEQLKKRGWSREEINAFIDKVKEETLRRWQEHRDPERIVRDFEAILKGVLRHEDA